MSTTAVLITGATTTDASTIVVLIIVASIIGGLIGVESIGVESIGAELIDDGKIEGLIVISISNVMDISATTGQPPIIIPYSSPLPYYLHLGITRCVTLTGGGVVETVLIFVFVYV